MRFAAAPEYHVFPTRERPLTPYQAVERATRETRRARARRRARRRHRPTSSRSRPRWRASSRACRSARSSPTSTRACRPAARRTPAARGCRARVPAARCGAAPTRCCATASSSAARQLNETRRRLGLPALERVHGGISEALALVATFPQLEYPRAWPAGTHVVGPLMWEPPAPDVALPPGDEPLVLIAPSTSQDPGPDAAARRAGRARRPARARARVGEPADPGRRAGAGQRPARRLGLLRARDAGLRRSSSATAGTAPSRARWPAAARVVDRPGGRRHERERGAGRLGGRRRAAAAAARRARAGWRSRSAARWRGRSCATARAGCRPGLRATTAPRARPTSSRRFAAGAPRASQPEWLVRAMSVPLTRRTPVRPAPSVVTA